MIIIISEKKSEPFWMQVPRSDLPFRWHYYLLCVPSNNADVQPTNEYSVFSPWNKLLLRSDEPRLYGHWYKKETAPSFLIQVLQAISSPLSLFKRFLSFLPKQKSQVVGHFFFCLAHFDFNFIIFQRRFNHETHRNFYQRVFIPGRIDTGRSSLLAAPQNIHLQGELI